MLSVKVCKQCSHPRMYRAEVKSTETVGPVLTHLITEKGHGYEPAVAASDKMHGVAKYDIITGKQTKPKATVSQCHFSWPRHVGNHLLCCTVHDTLDGPRRVSTGCSTPHHLRTGRC